MKKGSNTDPRNIRSDNVAAHGNFAVKEVVVTVHEIVTDPELDLLTSFIPHPNDILVEEVYGGIQGASFGNQDVTIQNVVQSRR